MTSLRLMRDDGGPPTTTGCVSKRDGCSVDGTVGMAAKLLVTAGFENGLLLSLYIAIHGKSRNVSDLNMPCLFTFDLRK
jgi:hypothetical protein